MSDGFRIYSGRRKRDPSAGLVEALAKRRPGSRAVQAAARRFYAPGPSWHCGKCAVECYQLRCLHCGKDQSETA